MTLLSGNEVGLFYQFRAQCRV